MTMPEYGTHPIEELIVPIAQEARRSMGEQLEAFLEPYKDRAGMSMLAYFPLRSRNIADGTMLMEQAVALLPRVEFVKDSGLTEGDACARYPHIVLTCMIIGLPLTSTPAPRSADVEAGIEQPQGLQQP